MNGMPLRPQLPQVKFKEGLPSPASYHQLFETSGWNEAYQADEEELSEAITNSWCTLSAYNEREELVGFGRTLSDGKLYAIICDMIVNPEYQDRGIGSLILETMIERCREAGIRVVWLFSASGKSGFYERHGFQERPLSAPGMQLNLNTPE